MGDRRSGFDLVDAAASMSKIVGFPIRWELNDPPPEVIVRLWPAVPLWAILGTTGLSIHHLVESKLAKAVAFRLFKTWREVERGEEVRRLEEAAKYSAWVRFYVGETA